MGGSSPAVCSPSRACLFTGRPLCNIANQGPWGYEISARFKLIEYASNGTRYPQRFDLPSDPRETRKPAAQRPPFRSPYRTAD